MNNLYEAPKSEIEPQGQAKYSPVGRPKGIWLVSLILFFVMAQFFNFAKQYIDSVGADALGQSVTMGLVVAIILAIRSVLILNPVAIKSVITLFAVIILIGLYQFVVLLVQNERIYYGILLVRVIPSIYVIWYLTRRSFIEHAERYNAYRSREAIAAYARSQLSKR